MKRALVYFFGHWLLSFSSMVLIYVFDHVEGEGQCWGTEGSVVPLKVRVLHLEHERYTLTWCSKILLMSFGQVLDCIHIAAGAIFSVAMIMRRCLWHWSGSMTPNLKSFNPCLLWAYLCQWKANITLHFFLFLSEWKCSIYICLKMTALKRISNSFIVLQVTANVNKKNLSVERMLQVHKW